MDHNFYGTEGIFKVFMALREEASIFMAPKELALLYLEHLNSLIFRQEHHSVVHASDSFHCG
jgi:hypothetical protein